MRPTGVFGTFVRYELKMLLRDTRTVLIAVVAPIVLFPLLLFVTQEVEEAGERRVESATYRYALAGDRAEWAGGVVEAALALDVPGDTTPADFERVDVGSVPAAGGADAEARIDSLLRAENLHLVVRGMSDGGDAGNRGDVGAAAIPAIRVEYRSTSDIARRASARLRDRLVRVRELRRDSLFRARGFPVDPGRVATVEEVNIASAGREAGAFLGLALTPFLLLLMISGGSIVAADAISGEKERGTLETLLTTAADRTTIVHAKLTAVVIVGLTVGVVNVANLAVYVTLGVVELPTTLAVELGVVDLALLLALIVPLTLLVGAALLLVSGYARSYREYQIYLLPLLIVLVAPSFIALLPGMELRSAVALAPISGIGVAVREVMVGERDWLFLALAFASTGGAAWGLTVLTERTLSTERLVGGGGRDEVDLVGGVGLFRRHVLVWFAAMWALFFVVSLWFGEALGVRGGILVNLVGVFLGGSVLMIRRYGLDLRETLSLRAPPPSAWLAVLIGAPTALVLAVGLAQLVDLYLFPVPDRIVEAFGRALGTDELPVWQVLLFLAVLPGVLEEIAFRGVLQHGLRRLRPARRVLAVGAIFGLFHVALFRIVPTAYLGIILASVVVLTGSIYPAMLWHFLNNALAVLPERLGWMEAGEPLPEWSYGVAGVGLAVAFWIMVRGRGSGRRRGSEGRRHP